jgi:UDP-glucose 4-epimerase
MNLLVTGSSGHLGEALVRQLQAAGHRVLGVDLKPSPFTARVGSITERGFIHGCMPGVEAVLHAASLHKPHVGTHSRQSFIDTNITGTLVLLEEAVSAGVGAFIYTSTTSAFGAALTPPEGAPAAWITEDVAPVPKNIYGVTKLAAEALCELFYRSQGLPCLVLRTARFFPEEDDRASVRQAYEDGNIKANEFTYRRVDIEDVVAAHLLALEKAASTGFRARHMQNGICRYIISATTPFTPEDRFDLRQNAPAVLARRAPDYVAEYARRGWKMFPGVERVYVNELARRELSWQPRYDFRYVLSRLQADEDPRSPLARLVGSKGYHDRPFNHDPYPV